MKKLIDFELFPSRPLTQVHLVNLAPTPFLRTFATAVVRSISLAGDDINDLTLSEDGNTLGWCGDEGRMGVGELNLFSLLSSLLPSDLIELKLQLCPVDLRTGVKTWMKGKHTSVRLLVSSLSVSRT